MPARRTVASYMTDTAAWVGDRGIQTVEEQRSVIRLRASLVDAMGVMKRSKKTYKERNGSVAAGGRRAEEEAS